MVRSPAVGLRMLCSLWPPLPGSSLAAAAHTSDRVQARRSASAADQHTPCPYMTTLSPHTKAYLPAALGTPAPEGAASPPSTPTYLAGPPSLPANAFPGSFQGSDPMAVRQAHNCIIGKALPSCSCALKR